jgi:hypothetical protein
MDRKIWKFITVFVFFSLILSGSFQVVSAFGGYFSARDQIKTAERLLTELKERGGQKYAPYEYCSAEKFLEISRMEFSENDFKSAKRFAERAKSAAEAGLAVIKKLTK